MTSNLHVKVLGLLLLLIAGCSINVHDSDHAANDDNGKNKDVTIKSPFGGLSVHTNNVNAKDTGLSVYPGSREKENEEGHDSKANVNINTPFFGLKVVAITYLTDDPQEKVWDYYKKEMSKYGKVLECRPGSPDMDIVSKDKDQLTCHDDGKSEHNQGINVEPNDIQLKVGNGDHQRVVGFKPSAKGTQFSLVYVVTRGDDKDKS